MPHKEDPNNRTKYVFKNYEYETSDGTILTGTSLPKTDNLKKVGNVITITVHFDEIPLYEVYIDEIKTNFLQNDINVLSLPIGDCMSG